jgi:predicted GNAT family acetyltransferase
MIKKFVFSYRSFVESIYEQELQECEMTGFFQDNPAQARYEYHVDNAMVTARYRKENGNFYIDFVEAPESLRGTGAAGRMMEQLVQVAQNEGLEIVPVCGYAASWLKRHKA